MVGLDLPDVSGGSLLVCRVAHTRQSDARKHFIST